MKNFVEKYFSTGRKKIITGKNLWKMEKEWFPLARKSFFTCRNDLSLAGTFLKNWIPHNLNNAFQKKKVSSRIRAQAE